MKIQVYLIYTEEHLEGQIDVIARFFLDHPHLVVNSLQKLTSGGAGAQERLSGGLEHIKYTTDGGQMAFNFVPTGLSVFWGDKYRGQA